MLNNVDDEFQKLQESYGSHLPDKIGEIEVAFNQLTSTWDSTNFTHFASLAHKLNGSAGIYGYADIGTIAAKIESIISRYDQQQADPDVMDNIKKLISELKEKINSLEKTAPDLEIKKIDTALVYLLNSKDDFSFGSNWSSDLTKQLDSFGYKLSVFNDINALFAALKDHRPLMMMISLDYISNPFIVNMNNASVKDALIACFKKNDTLFFSKSGEIAKRLEAVRMYGKSYLLLPFEISELINELDNLKKLWEEKFKVIIVDDDKEVITYYSNLLANSGIECKGILSYNEIEKTMHEFIPDLLLLDLNMDGCNGIELASLVRQQKMYEYLPIFYLSTEENKNVQVKALNVGADDFITKGTDPNILIEKIRIKASRYKKIQLLAAKNNLTGAFNFEYLMKEMERFIRGTKNTTSPLTIAILKIDNLNMINQSYGYNAADQLIVSLYVFLSNQLDFSRILGHYTNNLCIIVFPNTDKAKAEEELKKLQDKFKSSLHYADGKGYFSSFKFAMATYQNGEPIKKFIESTAAKL